MDTYFFTYNNHTIAVNSIGTGTTFILAFHGVLMDGTAFSFLNHLEGDFRILAIDLPLHGATNWHGSSVSADDVWQIVLLLKAHFSMSKYHIIGYSLGAKWVHVLLVKDPEAIQTVVYVAPDGITNSKYVTFATTTWLGKKLFKYLMHHTEPLKYLVSAGGRLGIISSKQKKYLLQTISKPKYQERIYAIWNAYAYLSTPLNRVVKVLNQYPIKSLLLVGALDTIISPKQVQPLRLMVPKMEYKVLAQGHHLLNSKILPSLQDFYNEH